MKNETVTHTISEVSSWLKTTVLDPYITVSVRGQNELFESAQSYFTVIVRLYLVCISLTK